MLTFLVQCSPPNVNTTRFFASPTLSRSMPWSRPWRTKKPKLWQRPFFRNGFVNLTSRVKFTPMAGRSLSTSYLTNYSPCLMLTILRHPQFNAQVEVFNKTLKKYLAFFMDDTTLDWETGHEQPLHHCHHTI
jgi:hypothetical protein